MSEKDPLFQSYGPFGGESVEHTPIYRETHRKKPVKLGLMLMFVALGLMMLMTAIMTAVQSYRVTPLYVLLFINNLGALQVPIFLTYFVYTDRLSSKLFWFIFVSGGMVLVQALGTDIIVFTK